MKEKKIYDYLERANEQIMITVERRRDIYDQRTERWQDSEAGEAYNELTDRLEEIGEEISEYLEELENA